MVCRQQQGKGGTGVIAPFAPEVTNLTLSVQLYFLSTFSPSLWQLSHLTSLYLNNNNLMRIPPDISRLENLTFLDLSYNKLRSLPAELGDLANLRELLLSHNYLRVLPYELGKLFQLQVDKLNPGLSECQEYQSEND